MKNKHIISKSLKFILKFFGVIIGISAVCLIAIFSVIFSDVNKSIELQQERMASLRNMYAQGHYIPVDEQKFCDFDLESTLQRDVKLIDLQFLATHNSYKKEKTTLEKTFSMFSNKLKQGNYSFETPTEQLNVGIRSFEFDLFCKESKAGVTFHSFHIGYADMSSNVFDFKLCLEEINLWSINNPNHLPITVILELKDRGGAYPYKTVESGHLSYLEKLIKSEMTTLYTPAKAFEGYENLNEMRANWDSPTLKETLGQVVFILHPTKLSEEYVALDPSFKSQTMFPAAYFWWDKSVLSQSFVIINNHGVIEGSIDENGGRKNGYLFRIMLDGGLDENIENIQVDKGLATGATICSTNRPPLFNTKEGYDSISFALDGKTVKLVSNTN